MGVEGRKSKGRDREIKEIEREKRRRSEFGKGERDRRERMVDLKKRWKAGVEGRKSKGREREKRGRSLVTLTGRKRRIRGFEKMRYGRQWTYVGVERRQREEGIKNKEIKDM